MKKLSYIYTIEKYCQGCNKCIFKCPTGANEAFVEADEGKVFIKDGFCISCGECLSICDHGARDFDDDTEEFFNSIKNGESISAIVAPSARFNFTDVKKVISYLKSIGVKNVYDVSFGADICTWAHVRLLQQQPDTSIISQPCPVVVSYIEKYRPELISHLSPVQSPAVCVATYLKKYVGITDKVMFLSPCIGKKRECKSTYTGETLDLNVTFTKFLEHLDSSGIDLSGYPQSEFDNMKGSVGFAFSRPGGLAENIKFHLDQDIWVKQVEGNDNIRRYLDEYRDDLKQGHPVPTVVDALNCVDGCNLGTGTSKRAKQNEIDFHTNRSKSSVSKTESERLMSLFDKTLSADHFVRKYKDRSFDYKKRDDVDMESAFASLGKFTKEEREINCFCCGYGNCYDFVYDLATGHNDKSNCRHYLLNKFKKLSLFDELTGAHNRNCFNMTIERHLANHPGFLGIIFIDINGLKEANDTYGHIYGDKLIIKCANICKEVFKEAIYRVGGDEFVVVYDSGDEASFDEKSKSLDKLLSKAENLIVSVGSSKSYDKSDVASSIDHADKAMYQAKQEYYKRINKAERRNRKFTKIFDRF